MKSEVLVIGSGIAGLTFAIKIANRRPDYRVLVLTKDSNDICNTAQAQGGMAVVLDRLRDSFEQHIDDTMKAGKGLSDRRIVEMVVSQAPERLSELIEWGATFDADELGDLQLGLEGGHSQRRIVHHRDLTGLEMHRKLLKKAISLPNISMYNHYFVTDLILQKRGSNTICTGIRALDKQQNQQGNIHSKITFLATGGSGMIFENTTNPSVSTADGVGMAYRAGAKIRNMQYIQFHPTALHEKDKHPLFLISEAVRGFGAYVVNHNGNRFLFRYDHRGELATRDVVSEAIVTELKSSGEKTAFLDCRHLNHDSFKKKFPTIVAYCASIGLDLQTDLIPVIPAAHYQCGGIEVDEYSRTSVGNLFASGECAHTGLHGANRLASNSLLEALVFSHQAAQIALKELSDIPFPETAKEVSMRANTGETDTGLLKSLRMRLNELMTYNLIHASGKAQQQEALENLEMLNDTLEHHPPLNCGTPEFFELRNMVQTSVLILQHALQSSKSFEGNLSSSS